MNLCGHHKVIHSVKGLTYFFIQIKNFEQYYSYFLVFGASFTITVNTLNVVFLYQSNVVVVYCFKLSYNFSDCPFSFLCSLFCQIVIILSVPLFVCLPVSLFPYLSITFRNWTYNAAIVHFCTWLTMYIRVHNSALFL
mgnify:CR=1 FL=1